MQAPLRIAHVCRVGWPHLGGMETQVAGLSAALADRGHDVRVVTLDRAITDDRPLPAGVHRGVPYRRVRRLGPRRYPFALGLEQAVAGADIVHVHGLDGLADQLVTWKRAPIGISTHGGFFHTERQAALKQVWLRTLTRRTLERADAVWFTSDADRETLSAARVDGLVVANGVEVERFAAVRRRPEPGRWLVLGRVDVHKGLDDLIEALAALRRIDRRRFRVDVVGPERVPGLVEQLEQRASAAGVSMRFLGAREDQALLEALSRCELALFPSRYEGFGVAVVEAMAAGVPVLVSAIPAHDRLVRDGVDGFRVDFRDARSAARAIVRLRERGHDGIAERARASAQAYAWSRRVAEWEERYRALIGRRR